MLSSHLYLGLPCDLLVRGFQLNIFLTVLVSDILCTWPNQLSLWAFMAVLYHVNIKTCEAKGWQNYQLTLVACRNHMVITFILQIFITLRSILWTLHTSYMRSRVYCCIGDNELQECAGCILKQVKYITTMSSWNVGRQSNTQQTFYWIRYATIEDTKFYLYQRMHLFLSYTKIT